MGKVDITLLSFPHQNCNPRFQLRRFDLAGPEAILKRCIDAVGAAVGLIVLSPFFAIAAVIIKQELLLPFIGGVFVLEALSVIIQVGSYKLRKKRVFKMAPLHHHFELLGWSESKVIARFWIASLIFALFALTTLKLR